MPLFSVEDSRSLLLNSQRPLSFGFTSGLLEMYFSCLSVCLSVWLFVLSVLIYQHLTDPGTMGQRHSSPTPLSSVIDNFKEVKMRAHDLSVEIKRKKRLEAS